MYSIASKLKQYANIKVDYDNVVYMCYPGCSVSDNKYLVISASDEVHYYYPGDIIENFGSLGTSFRIGEDVLYIDRTSNICHKKNYRIKEDTNMSEEMYNDLMNIIQALNAQIEMLTGRVQTLESEAFAVLMDFFKKNQTMI